MISILTPTFNRSSTLERLYCSLVEQTDRDFEWIVVDDGSSDRTPSMLEGFSGSAQLSMQVIRQENSGKHVAVNVGVAHAHGDYIFIVDSDDALVPNAVYTVAVKIREYPGNVGYCFRKFLFDGTHLGTKMSPEPLFLSPNEAAKVFKADLAYIFTKQALQAHPFPVVPGEKFVPELFVWNEIGDSGKIIYFPDEWVYQCEYRDDGLSRNFKRNLRQNPKGFGLFYRDQTKRQRGIVSKSAAFIRYIQCGFYRVVK